MGKKDRRGRVALSSQVIWSHFSKDLAPDGFALALACRLRGISRRRRRGSDETTTTAAHAKKLKFSCNYGFRISPGFYWADIHPSTLPSSILSSFAQLIRLSPFPSPSPFYPIYVFIPTGPGKRADSGGTNRAHACQSQLVNPFISFFLREKSASARSERGGQQITNTSDYRQRRRQVQI